MVSVLTSSVVDLVLESQWGQSKDKIDICCFSAKTQNQENVSQWSDMSTHTLLF